MRIVVVGTVAFDSIETPFGSAEKILGGSALYISLAARFFVPEVALVAVVGGDFPGEAIAMIADRGIDVTGLEVAEQGKTFAWEGRYRFDLNDRETIATHLNVLTTFNPVVPGQYREGSLVCLGNLDPSTQESVIRQSVNPSLTVMDTMNFWIEQTPGPLHDTLRLVDCLIINDAEARQLSGEPNLIKAAAIIRRLGPRHLVVKKGEHGALLFAEEGVFSAPAYPLEDIHDPTGAGDAFMGGFVGYLAARGDVSVETYKSAVVYGSAVASFCVEKFGPDRLLEITPADIERRVDEFRALSEIPAPASVFQE
jgi:sugar/nucleoside kinase (ribokinase family)